MTIETMLSNKLGITYIDARSICVEAKLSLGVTGYPTQEQKELLLEEGVRLYEERPLRVREAMKSNRQSLDAG